MPWGAAAAVVGAYMSSQASQDAAETQAASADKASGAQLAAAREANQLQERMYTQNRADVGPWRGAGVNALRKLQYGLGLPYEGTTVPGTVAGFGGAQAAPTVAQFTSGAIGGTPEQLGLPTIGPGGELTYPNRVAATEGTGGTFNEAAYNAAMAAHQQQQGAAQGTPWNPEAGGPEAGYLSRDFKMSDYQQDPGYGFRLSEGMKALERSAAARGGLLSGAMLKGVSRYGQDYASNEFTNAFNRYMQQRGNQYNQLASMAGIGQTATANLGAAGQAYAGSVGNNLMTGAARSSDALMSGAAARASGYVGGSNAMNQGIGGALKYYTDNNLLNRQNGIAAGANSFANYGGQDLSQPDYSGGYW